MFETKIQTNFLSFFDNPITKNFAFKSFLHTLAALSYLSKSKILGLAFGRYFLHTFPIKRFLLWYSINRQVSISDLSFSRYQRFKFLSIDDGISFKIYLQSSSQAMADNYKKRRRWKYKNLNILRRKKVHLMISKAFFITF